MSHKNDDRLKIWKDRIAVMYLVKEKIQSLDRSGIWQYYYPEVAATKEELANAETHLGYELDKYYKDFLMCANGWKCFIQSVNLFGTYDLMGSDLMNQALKTLDVMDDAYPLKYTGFSKEDFLPIAATFEDKDLHVITRTTSSNPGVVIWFAGQEIERYPNFEEYFLAMIDYNRLEIDSFNTK